MLARKVRFPNSQGALLGARLDLPVDGRFHATALFAHCFTCTKNLKAVNHISRSLTRQGIAVFRFDFTGLGESEGDFADTNFSSNVDDLVAAAAYLEQQFQAPQILIGHSLGGAAVLQATSRIPATKAVVTIGAPCQPKHVSHLLQSSRSEIEAEGEARVLLAGRTFTIRKQFLDDLAEQRMTETIRNLDAALLVMHSPLDNTVGIENAAHIFQSARHPKSFVTLDQADHLLSNGADAQYAGTVLAAWAARYVDIPTPELKPVAAADDRVVVRIDDAHYRTEIRARSGHSLVADEPMQDGGTNLGPNPYDYLLAGLGSCTVITLRMYADRKGWPLETAVVHLRHDKIHAKDCEDCETQNGRVDRITRELELTGPLDDSQRDRLLQIADRCPVHRTLTSETVIQTRLIA